MFEKLEIQDYCETFTLFDCIFLPCNCYCCTTCLFLHRPEFFNYLLIACVCVCVFVCVCMCVSLFVLFHRKDSFRLRRCLGHTWGYGSAILCCEYYSRCFCQVPSFPFLKMSYFTSKDETSASQKTGEKTI